MPHSPPGPKGDFTTGGSTAPDPAVVGTPRYLAQFDHADLGLVDDDDTEMLTAPVIPVVDATGGSRPNPPITRKASSAMTLTQHPDVPLPPGADLTWTDDWASDLNGIPYRLIWSRPMPGWSKPNPGFADDDVRVVVTQFDDGHIGTAGDDAPLVYCGQDSYSPEAARALAAVLTAAADLADRWASR